MTANLRLYDNTRLSAFKKCPRYYFYRHVMDWEVVARRMPLVFGGAWHAAMEVVWPMLAAGQKKTDVMNMAYAAFVQKWVEEGLPEPKLISYEMEKELSPRTPAVALEMIAAYVDERAKHIQGMEIISVERPFVVPLDPQDDTLFYIGKIDKVVQQRGKKKAIEHKTTTAYKKDGKFKTNFVDSFSPNSQVDGYLYALHMTYGTNNVSGVWVDAALVHKTETGFLFVPVEKKIEQLDMWLWETRYWIDMLEANLKNTLEYGNPSDKYMASFPKRTESCFDFNSSCEYINVCRSWPNPLGHDTPPGFKVHKWDPLEFNPDAAKLLPGG